MEKKSHSCAGCGGLDHDTDFDIAHLDAFLLQFLAALFQGSLGLLQLPDGDDHREHDGKVAVSGSTQQGAQLLLEEVVSDKADTKGAEAEGRVVLVIQVHVVDGLVCADIAGTDDHGLRSKALDCELVGLELLFLGRLYLVVEVDELGTEQADAAGVVLLDCADVAGSADVRVDLDGMAVDGGVRLALQLLQEREASLADHLTRKR